jgi:crotonobetaine/carnitine-CoA ligase
MPEAAVETGRALWRWRVETTPARPFLHWEERTWSFAEFDEEVRRLAAGLDAAGARTGEPVLVGIGNRPEALLAGLGFEEMAYPIEHCEGRLLLLDGDSATVILPRLGELRGVARVFVTDDVEIPAGVASEPLGAIAETAAAKPRRLPEYDRDSLAAILYTSGSTGRPKGVMLRAGCFESVGHTFSQRFGVTADDVYLLPTSLSHAVGSLTALSIVLQTGCRIHLVDRFSPSRFWHDVAAHGATFSILFPAHLNLLLEADDGSVEPGGHSFRLAITHAHNRRFAERFGTELATVWGMTETGAQCVGSEPGYRGELGDNYVGTPMEGVEVGVFDDRMEPVADGAVGEIVLRHRDVMLGYLKDPDATAQTLVDGWVRSGDQGVLDESGRLFFVGRIKNLIKRSGENVSAEEVEEALTDLADVAECTVFGVPDRIRTEEVAAVVVRRSDSDPQPIELHEDLTSRLARWKLPRYLLVTERPLPRLPNGKLDRVRLREGWDLSAAWDSTASEQR